MECDGLPSLSYLTACRQGYAEASKNFLNVESPSDLLDRGCISRRRNLTPISQSFKNYAFFAA
jgi:hypothetical protein